MELCDIEICCSSIQSAANAKRGGALRIELCQALSEGGTTPSYATIAHCVRELALDVFVLVRPRGGDFHYNDMEIKTMEEDVRVCKELGATGIVVGFLNQKGDIDEALTRHFVEIASPLPVTFHRAFDECAHPFEAMETIIDCGCKRILTSGCQPTALQGANVLRQLVKQADGRIRILAGSGITPDNAFEIIEQTSVNEIHGSCKRHFLNGTVETNSETVAKLIANIVGK